MIFPLKPIFFTTTTPNPIYNLLSRLLLLSFFQTLVLLHFALFCFLLISFEGEDTVHLRIFLGIEALWILRDFALPKRTTTHLPFLALGSLLSLLAFILHRENIILEFYGKFFTFFEGFEISFAHKTGVLDLLDQCILLKASFLKLLLLKFNLLLQHLDSPVTLFLLLNNLAHIFRINVWKVEDRTASMGWGFGWLLLDAWVKLLL